MEITPRAYATVLRRLGQWRTSREDVEDALQTAALEWAQLETKPANPTGWLIRRGYQRLSDARRSEAARARLLTSYSSACDGATTEPVTLGAEWWVFGRAVERAGAGAADRIAIAVAPATRSQRHRAIARLREVVS